MMEPNVEFVRDRLREYLDAQTDNGSANGRS